MGPDGAQAWAASRCTDSTIGHRLSGRWATADDRAKQGPQVRRSHGQAPDLHGHDRRHLAKSVDLTGVRQVVHTVDRPAHDQVRAQGRDGPWIGRPRRADDLDAAEAPGAPHHRRTQPDQQRPHLAVGGDHAADGGR